MGRSPVTSSTGWIFQRLVSSWALRVRVFGAKPPRADGVIHPPPWVASQSAAWNLLMPGMSQQQPVTLGPGACGRHPDNTAHKTGMPGEAEAWWVITRVPALVDIVRPLSHVSS